MKKVFGKCHGLFARACKMRRKKLKQLGHVFRSLTQWRCVERQHVQAVIQVFPKAACFNLSLQVSVRGRNHPHMDLHRPQAAHRVNGSLLQNTQQLDLHVQRQVADLVQENCSAVGQLKATHPVCHSACESAFAVAEQLALEQILGDGRAVDGHKIAVFAQRLVVQCPCHQLLARTAFAGDQHRGGGVGDERYHVTNRFGGLAASDVRVGFFAGHRQEKVSRSSKVRKIQRNQALFA